MADIKTFAINSTDRQVNENDLGFSCTDFDLDALNTILKEIIGDYNSQFDAIPPVIDTLTSTSTESPLAANQGRVLKAYVDDIIGRLLSDDNALDELQEVVDFIKLNRSTLNTLSIPSIAGLQAALDARISRAEIIDNLTTANSSAPLSAKQGSILNSKIEAIKADNVTIKGDGTITPFYVDIDEVKRQLLEC